MSFARQVDQLQQQITKLGPLMDEADALEAQKLAVLGFDQDNILETEISYRFTEQVNVVQQLYQNITEEHPTELSLYLSKNRSDTIASMALESFRNGQAELAHLWDLFGE